jgi:hypothetical protein
VQLTSLDPCDGATIKPLKTNALTERSGTPVSVIAA